MTQASVQRRHEARERLEQAVQALTESDGWQAWLRTRSAFRRYSLSNTMLIAMQRPDATRVAGFCAWERLGRKVRAGEKGISILAPRTFKVRDEAGDETDEVRLYFAPVCVFDVAQTDGEPLPEPPREPIMGDSHAHLLPRLTEYARSIGYAVAFEPTGSAALGYCDEHARRIVVAPDLPANAKACTLIPWRSCCIRTL